MSEHEPTPENSVETEIKALLEELKTFDDMGWFHKLDEDAQGWWYNAEMESRVGSDREQARDRLAEFLQELKRFIK